LTPSAPAAIAMLRIHASPDALQAVVDRPLPVLGRGCVGRVRARDHQAVDEAVVVRIADDELDVMVHGGPGVRAAIDVCLAGHRLKEQREPPGCDARWRRLATAASPAAVRWMLANPEIRPPFSEDFLHRPAVILITGPANAGKSTLLNAWCGWRRALVSDQPGTTRDLVMAETVAGGWRLRLVDSAGLRPTSDALEQAGQRLAGQARGWADVVVRLVPPDGSASDAQATDVVVASKADLGCSADAALPWSVHGHAGRTADALLAAVSAAVLARLQLPPL
jgi:hypothetical protein